MVIQLTNDEAQLIVDCLRAELQRADTQLRPTKTDTEKQQRTARKVLDKLLSS